MLLSYSRSCEITPLSRAFVKSCFYFNFWKMLYSVRLCVAVVQSDSTSLKLVSIGKVRMHITITVHYCDSVSVFYCFRDITIFLSKICILLPFLPSSVSFEAIARVFSYDLWYESWYKNYSPWVARWWTPHEQFWRITTVCWIDRQTADMPLVVMARSSIDERDKTKPKRTETVE